jgi:Uma2 family endonuclease
MSVAFVDSALSWDDLLRTWRELEVPDGWRPEVTLEGIHMTPPPGGPHNLIAGTVNRGLMPAIPDGCEIFQTLGVGIRQIGGFFVPDLCVMPRASVPRTADPAPAEHVLLAVEITSRSNAEHDRKTRKWAYAHGGIPQYLLIDPHDEDGPAVSLFSDPADGAYRKACRVAFGQPIALGEPFAITLDTAEFEF